MLSRKRLDRRIRALSEIRSIMRPMRDLSLMEVRKLQRRLECQQRVVRSIEAAAADFLSCLGLTQPSQTEGMPHIYLVIGSERGLCGDFNAPLIEELNVRLGERKSPNVPVIAVGYRLGRQLKRVECELVSIPGPSFVEEVDQVLTSILGAVENIRQQRGTSTLSMLFRQPENAAVCAATILPPFTDDGLASPPHENAPDINLPVQDLFSEIVDHYLFAALHEKLYKALMAENLQRAQHLRGAIDKLDGEIEELGRKQKILRHEQITEEIEVVLTNSEITVDGARG